MRFFVKYFQSRYWPFWILALIIFIWDLLTQWVGDAISYQYVFQPDFADFTPSDRISTISDIFISQYNHYIFQNGRIFIQSLVQLYCGLLGQAAFALCNAAVWGILPPIMIKMAGGRISGSIAVIASSLAVIIFYYLPPDPSYQMNYVWIALLTVGFLYIFFKKSKCERSVGQYALIAFYSLCAGNGNEAFSIPIGLMVAVYTIKRRFRLNPDQWVAFAFFCIGALIIVFSPGTLARINHNNGSSREFLNAIEGVIPAFILPGLWLISFVFLRNFLAPKGSWLPNYLLWIGVIASWLLAIVLRGVSGARVLIPANIFIAVILIQRLMSNKSKKIWAVCLCAGSCGLLTYTIVEDMRLSAIDRKIYAEYAVSADGTVYLPDEDMARVARRYIEWKKTYLLNAAYTSPGKPTLKVLPEKLKEVLKADTNLVVPVNDRAYLMVRSSKTPKEFVIRKTLLPGVLNRSMAPRQVEWNREGDILLDTTSEIQIGIYINPRPYIGAIVELGSFSD